MNEFLNYFLIVCFASIFSWLLYFSLGKGNASIDDLKMSNYRPTGELDDIHINQINGKLTIGELKFPMGIYMKSEEFRYFFKKHIFSNLHKRMPSSVTRGRVQSIQYNSVSAIITEILLRGSIYQDWLTENHGLIIGKHFYKKTIPWQTIEKIDITIPKDSLFIELQLYQRDRLYHMRDSRLGNLLPIYDAIVNNRPDLSLLANMAPSTEKPIFDDPLGYKQFKKELKIGIFFIIFVILAVVLWTWYSI
jgi:hypothetical protein